VQREIPVIDVVKGTSVIKQEFAPGRPVPTPLKELRQQTTDIEKEFLDKQDTERREQQPVPLDEAKLAVQKQIEKEVKQQSEQLKQMLDQEIEKGLLEVETEHSKIIIRIQEKASFASGQATLNPSFYAVISKITEVIAATPGRIIVAGHTDNIPISNARFRSNWELSSARAVTVVHAMLTNPKIDAERILVEGHADSNPLVPNDSWENRAKNRRVELIIQRGEDLDSGKTLSIDEPDTTDRGDPSDVP
jgi:chemotaxis protein MotB